MALHHHLHHPLVATLLLVTAALFAVAGCGSKSAPPPAAKPRLTLTQDELRRHRPDESGAVMIVMYHHFEKGESSDDLNRSPEDFRADLTRLQREGYYPVTVSELVTNTMDVPAGKTPVALTFDDSAPTQFKVITGSDGRPHIDPDSAVGIMETFNRKNPGWPPRATFFVLPKRGKNTTPFGQPEAVSQKFSYLRQKGYEVANHSATHQSLRGASAAEVSRELATAVKDIKELSGMEMKVLALPFGKVPRDARAKAALRSGSDGGTSYQNIAVLQAAWRPVLSPVTKKDAPGGGGTFCSFDPYSLERIKPNPLQAKVPGTLEYWLDWFRKNPGTRYRSDGNPRVVAVPKEKQSLVDSQRLAQQGKRPQFYALQTTAPGAKGDAGSSDLSVQ